MPDLPSFSFSKIGLPSAGTVIVPVASGKAMGPVATALDESCGGAVTRAMEIAGFEGKAKATLDIIAPQGGIDRISLIGVGSAEGRGEADWRNLGGVAAAFVKPEASVTVLMELGEGDDVTSEDAAAFADGIRLKSYTFDRHKTGKGDTGDKKKKDKKPAKIAIASADAAGVRKIFKSHSGVTDGVFFARDLVNEPANILGPVEFATRVEKLKSLGVEVQILGEKELTKLGMGALLGVAQGSVRPPRVAVMKWKGVKSKSKSKDFEAPLAFVGKGVVFDTGGISLKPPGGMEDMKGDMGGAACRRQALMFALWPRARRRSTPSVSIGHRREHAGWQRAMRPADIVTSMSGQTIEIINTDAEGRLVLADRDLARAETSLQAEIHDRSGHPHRGDHHFAGPFSCRAVLQRRHFGGNPDGRGPCRGRTGVAHAARRKIRQDAGIEIRRHEERRRALRRRDYRGAIPAAVRQ